MFDDSPLAELREVEERIAVRMARIDQLEAGARSSEQRGLRFARTLVIVGVVGALPPLLLGVQQSHGWALDGALAAAAFALAAIMAFLSLAVRMSSRERVPIARVAMNSLAAILKRSPSWQPFPIPYHHRHGDPRDSRSALWLSALALGAIPLVGAIGSAALAIFAVLLSSAVLRVTWSRQASVPGAVQLAAVLVSLIAALSVGTWAGGLTSAPAWERHTPMGAAHRVQATGGVERAESATPAAGRTPTFESLCGRWVPRSNAGPPQAIAQLRRAWFAAGALVAGCPGTVFSTGTGNELVASIGRSPDGQILSLGIADSERGVLLYGGAAAAAERLSRVGLIGVPTHLIVGNGDLYLLNTTAGTYALLRRTAPLNACEAREAGPGCSASLDQYTVISPALATAWVAEMSRNRDWLWPEPSTPTPSGPDFEFVGENSRVVARASCNGVTGACELPADGASYTYRQPAQSVTPEQVLRFAPSPSPPE